MKKREVFNPNRKELNDAVELYLKKGGEIEHLEIKQYNLDNNQIKGKSDSK